MVSYSTVAVGFHVLMDHRKGCKVHENYSLKSTNGDVNQFSPVSFGLILLDC